MLQPMPQRHVRCNKAQLLFQIRISFYLSSPSFLPSSCLSFTAISLTSHCSSLLLTFPFFLPAFLPCFYPSSFLISCLPAFPSILSSFLTFLFSSTFPVSSYFPSFLFVCPFFLLVSFLPLFPSLSVVFCALCLQ